MIWIGILSLLCGCFICNISYKMGYRKGLERGVFVDMTKQAECTIKIISETYGIPGIFDAPLFREQNEKEEGKI